MQFSKTLDVRVDFEQIPDYMCVDGKSIVVRTGGDTVKLEFPNEEALRRFFSMVLVAVNKDKTNTNTYTYVYDSDVAAYNQKHVDNLWMAVMDVEVEKD